MNVEGPEALAGKRIDSRADAALAAIPESVRGWVEQDIDDFKIISDPDLARFAAVTITENFDTPGYKAVFDALAPSLGERLQTLYEQNAAMSWERDESDLLGYAFDLMEQEQRAKQWTPEEARAHVDASLVNYLNPRQENPMSLTYEKDMQIADMARNAMVSEAFRDALQAANPEVSRKVAAHPVRPAADLLNATFVGKIVAISSAHLEMKIGRDPSETMAHPRLGLSGDPVQVGQVATIKYAKGHGHVSNHELARGQKGVGR